MIAFWRAWALRAAPLLTLVACGVPAERFDDHTRESLADPAGFYHWSGERVGARIVKFHLIPFADPPARHITYLDSEFYEVHDEWYWFRLLNGQEIEGDPSFDPYDGSFPTVADIYSWAMTQPEPLPVGLEWSGARLYSPRFYELTRDTDDDPKHIAPGVVMHFPAREVPTPREEIWAFEIPFAEDATLDEIEVYFELLEASLPPEIANEVVWVSRSASQELLVRTMRDQQLPRWEQTMLYSELSAPLDATVHTAGVTAGRVRMFPTAESVVPTSLDTIVVLGEPTDELPSARAVITGFAQDDQDPLAEAAEEAGVVNVSLVGAVDDPDLEQFSRVWAHAIIYAQGDGEYLVAPIAIADYWTWKDLDMSEDFLVDLLQTTGAL